MGCDEWRDVDEFCVSVKATDGRHSYCRQCTRDKKYRARYGLTVIQVDALRAAQAGRCKLCGIHEDETVYGLFVDHDHSHCSAEAGCPECVRGLLCRACNAGIGNFRDDVDRLLTAIEYIKHKGDIPLRQ